MTVTSLPPVGIQLYTLRDVATADGMRSVLERVAAIGYRGVESAGFFDLTPAEFAGTCADLGLALASAHIMLGSDDELASTLDTHAALGFGAVVVPVLWPDDFASTTVIDAAADRLSAAAALAAERGLAFGYHNHFWEFGDIDGTPALARLFAATDPLVLAEVDIYWTQVGGLDPAAFVAELGGRVRWLHVKDGPADGHESAMTAVGDGVIDIAAAVEAASDAHWHLVELDRCETDIFAAVARSYDHLVGNGLSAGRAP